MGAAILGNVKLTVGWLYPDLMNIYGDRGNILTLLRRAEWHGHETRLVELGRGATEAMADVDIFLFGGGQDREEALVFIGHHQIQIELLNRAAWDGAQYYEV